MGARRRLRSWRWEPPADRWVRWARTTSLRLGAPHVARTHLQCRQANRDRLAVVVAHRHGSAQDASAALYRRFRAECTPELTGTLIVHGQRDSRDGTLSVVEHRFGGDADRHVNQA